MSAPPRPKRAPRAPHDWSHETPRLSRWYYLARLGPGEVELVEGDGPITGYARSCDRCGIVQVFASLRNLADLSEPPTWRMVTFTGFDFDSLTPMRTPPCEVLLRPGSTAEDLVGLVDVRQLELDLRQGAAA